MNKIKKLVCMLLVVCFSVAAFPFTFASASSSQIAIQEASTGRYLTAKDSNGANLTFESSEYWFEECKTDTEGEFTLKLNESNYKVTSFKNIFDSGLETNGDESVVFKLKSAGDGTYFLNVCVDEVINYNNPSQYPGQSQVITTWYYVQSFNDGDIDLTSDKDKAVKVNVYRK